MRALTTRLTAVGLALPCCCHPVNQQAPSSSLIDWQHAPSSSALTDWQQVYQVITLYARAVDFNQTRQLFPLIFAADAFANYSSDEGSRDNLTGLRAITDALAPDGDKFGAQHLFGSIAIDVDPDHDDDSGSDGEDRACRTANSTAYALTTAFGRGSRAGRQVQFYGVYRDTFELVRHQGWRIKTRHYAQQGPPYGDIGVLQG